MSGRIEQINVSHDRDEDRLLLRIHASGNEEIRMWMTRRYTQVVLRALEKIFTDFAAPGSDLPAANRSTEIAFDHAHATAKADYDTPYQEDAEKFPLGEGGVLGYRVTVEQKTPPVIHLMPRSGPGISFPGHPTLVHNIYNLLRKAAEGADWQLTMNVEALSGESAGHLLN